MVDGRYGYDSLTNEFIGFDLVNFIDNEGPFTIKFKERTVKFFPWPKKDRESDSPSPGCNVRTWYKGKELDYYGRDNWPDDASVIYVKIMKIACLA